MSYQTIMLIYECPFISFYMHVFVYVLLYLLILILSP